MASAFRIEMLLNIILYGTRVVGLTNGQDQKFIIKVNLHFMFHNVTIFNLFISHRWNAKPRESPNVFFKKGILKSFVISAGKYLYRHLFLIKLQANNLQLN